MLTARGSGGGPSSGSFQDGCDTVWRCQGALLGSALGLGPAALQNGFRVGFGLGFRLGFRLCFLNVLSMVSFQVMLRVSFTQYSLRLGVLGRPGICSLDLAKVRRLQALPQKPHAGLCESPGSVPYTRLAQCE